MGGTGDIGVAANKCGSKTFLSSTLIGHIPTEIGLLSNLQVIRLAANRLSGAERVMQPPSSCAKLGAYVTALVSLCVRLFLFVLIRTLANRARAADCNGTHFYLQQSAEWCVHTRQTIAFACRRAYYHACADAPQDASRASLVSSPRYSGLMHTTICSLVSRSAMGFACMHTWCGRTSTS